MGRRRKRPPPKRAVLEKKKSIFFFFPPKKNGTGAWGFSPFLVESEIFVGLETLTNRLFKIEKAA